MVHKDISLRRLWVCHFKENIAYFFHFGIGLHGVKRMNEELEVLECPENLEPEVLQTEPVQKMRYKGFSSRMRVAIALLLSAATVLCKAGNPEGAERARRWIVGDGSEQVQQAFFRMEEALGEGEGMAEAVAVFCRELTNETA